ncbi:MAG: MBL fold metallo-hydrolase [Acidobacteria bacterium]|nr:MBL fold metallo-hydrolase [Acidobacteriota bacterium]
MLNTPRQVLPGAWQITLPLPFELSSVNVYLVRLRDGWLLIDCGLGAEESFESLRSQSASLGVPLEAITEILLTHTHPDHVGQARRLLELTGARLSISRDELEQLLRLAGSDRSPVWLDRTLHQAGVPPELVTRIEVSFDKIRRNFQELTPDRILEAGDVMETAAGPLEVILTPGHSPGHVCLYSSEHRALFSGDHILETITPNIGWLPERDALGEFLSSMDRVTPREISRLLPGHGLPFTGHREWIVATRRHHDERCGQIVTSLRGGPRTAHELVGDLWARPLAPFHHRFAVFEVMAHLEYLRRLGRVKLEGDRGFDLWRV